MRPASSLMPLKRQVVREPLESTTHSLATSQSDQRVHLHKKQRASATVDTLHKVPNDLGLPRFASVRGGRCGKTTVLQRVIVPTLRTFVSRVVLTASSIARPSTSANRFGSVPWTCTNACSQCPGSLADIEFQEPQFPGHSLGVLYGPACFGRRSVRFVVYKLLVSGCRCNKRCLVRLLANFCIRLSF